MSRTLQLRTRIAIAGSLLIATTVVIGVWSVTAFREVSRVVGDTVTANEHVTDATTRLANALEREDDALLLVLSDPTKGRPQLVRERSEVEAALAQVTTQLTLGAADRLRANVGAYQRASDALVAEPAGSDRRLQYHDRVNPLLRRAVANTNEIRDEHFLSSQAVAEWAGDQSTRSMQIAATISIVGLLLLVVLVLHLARVVMRPIGEMTRAVGRLRRGDFAQRVAIRRDDELGRLGDGFNRMADELEEFRRTNIGEVIHAKETLEATLDAFPDAVLVIDEERTVSAANPRAIEILGSARERGLHELPVPAETRELVDSVLRSGIAMDKTVDLGRAIALPVGDRTRRLLPRVVPIATGRGAVLVLSDVTDLARLDEMRLELVAVASHELRTPLTTMRMTLSMLHERAATHEDRDRELVATAMLGVDQLSLLVDEFLDLTRIEAGQLRLQLARVSVRELIGRAVTTIAPACEQARVALDVQHGELPPSIAADAARLAMVVSNLLANAVKYTPAGGRILVRTAEDAGSLMIEVADSGPGVPPEYRERIFDRFFRVEHGASAGAGIGLYIARQVIEAHGGTIRCTASAFGGASFVVTMPVETSELTPARPSAAD